MYSKIKRKYLIISFLALILLTRQNECFAAYDIIKAKDVSNQYEIVDKQTENEELIFDSDLPQYDPEKDLGSVFSKKIKKIFKRKKTSNEEVVQEETSETAENSQPTINYDNQTTIDEKNRFNINADKVTYDDSAGNIIAQGNVEIISRAQDVTLKADNAVLDKEAQTLQLTGNVKVIKKGIEMDGESLIVDLNEQNILMDNPVLNAYSFAIHAQEGYLIANDIQLLNGTLKSTSNSDYQITTNGFMRYDNVGKEYGFDRKAVNELDVDAKRQVYKIDSKEVVITSYKDHNSVLLKGSNVFYNNHKVIRNSDIEIVSGKKTQITDTNLPEAGNLRNFGSYIGYGMLFKMPKGHAMKIMPVLAYHKSNVGVGAIGRYRSPNHMVEGGWNSASENWVFRGRYRMSDKLTFDYGRNAYIPEGFMGARRSGYAGQLQYFRTYNIKDLDATFSDGIYAGVFSDYDKHDQEDAYSTTRFRYMANLGKGLFRYNNKDKDFLLQLNSVLQGAATVYGSGENTGIIRIGPNITTRYKKWEQSLAYMISGVHGESPFMFDEYRYGKSTIQLNEKFSFNDKFALGFRLFVTPKKDNPQEDLFTETRVYAVFGPRDMKVAFSYDFVRDVSHLDFMFLIGSDNAKINFDKLSTKDIDGKQERNDFYKNAKRVTIEKPENI